MWAHNTSNMLGRNAGTLPVSEQNVYSFLFRRLYLMSFLVYKHFNWHHFVTATLALSVPSQFAICQRCGRCMTWRLQLLPCRHIMKTRWSLTPSLLISLSLSSITMDYNLMQKCLWCSSITGFDSLQ